MANTGNSATIDERIDAVGKELQALTIEARETEKARKPLMAISQQTVNALELGPDAIWRLLMQPHQSASLRAALEMGLIDALNTGESPKSAVELAKTTGSDKLLVVRILRPLVAMNVIVETGFETYKAGPVAQALAIPPLAGGFKFMYDEAALSCVKLPDFLSKNEYKNPDNPQGIFQYAHDSPLHMFQWLQQHPKQMNNFNVFMGGQRHNRVDWFDSFPVDKILFQGAQSDNKTALLVDIAGGHGYDLEAFKKRFPDASGKLILQELPSVIAEIQKLDEGVVRMEYDFFTPQPIKGARAYYMRSILHDWSDQKCREILQNIVAAMTPVYSKLLMNEWVLSDVGVPLYPALLDINMMALLSGMERTKTQWKELLASVGLTIVNFWSVGAEDEGLIEAVREH